MSRSKRPQCSTGRGCRCCGDAGEVRRTREDEASRVDEREQDGIIPPLLLAELDAAHIDDQVEHAKEMGRL